MEVQLANRPIIEIWEPTYLMKPKDDEKFVPHEVEAIVKSTMQERLKDIKWEEDKCKALSLELCSEIKEKVKGQLLFCFRLSHLQCVRSY